MNSTGPGSKRRLFKKYKLKFWSKDKYGDKGSRPKNPKPGTAAGAPILN